MSLPSTLTRRRTLAGLVVLGSLALGLTACVQVPPGAGATPTPSSAVDALKAAAAKNTGKSFNFSLNYGTFVSATGASSGDGKSASMRATIKDPVSGLSLVADIIVSDSAYAKADLGVLAALFPGLDTTKWQRIDVTRAPALARLGIKPGTESFGAENIVKGVVSATATTPTEYTGTVDLGQATIAGVPTDQAKALPDSSRIAPFKATLDASGNITKLVISVPAVGVFLASDLTLTYSDFGTGVTPSPLTANQVVDAPVDLYRFLQ